MVVIDNESINLEFEERINIESKVNLLKETLDNNVKIEDKLNVISVISNVCEFKTRWRLMKEFIERMNSIQNINFYVVELAYDNQEFNVTNSSNPNHLQLRTKHALWHKENMINIGIKKLLPSDWKSVAWIDGDIEFDNPNWAVDTLKILTKFDIVQLFTTCMDLDKDGIPMNIWQSYGYKFTQGEKFRYNRGINYWHSGYAWACTRQFYDKVGGLYDKGIIGSGDYILTQGILKHIACADKSLTGFNKDITEYVDNLNNVIVGYVPNNIRHHYHGSKVNRKYIERNEILVKYNYDPKIHITYDKDGIIIPTEYMSEDFINDIKLYFSQRNEDDI
jgi:hypothetical protein